MKSNLRSGFSRVWNHVGIGIAAWYVSLAIGIALSKYVVHESQHIPLTAQVEVSGQIINLEVANTPSQQAHGLMNRHRLSAHQGMLFPVHPPRKARLWMKNMDIPLDMIFLRRSMVIAIASEVPPCQSKPCPVYGPDALVDQVIELRGGRSLELGIRVGSKIDTLRVR